MGGGGGGGGGAKQVAMCLRGDARTLLCTFRSNRKVDRHSAVGRSSSPPPLSVLSFSTLSNKRLFKWYPDFWSKVLVPNLLGCV